jgi:sulfur relay (sulfurtransferase) DsrC/TusE family protein
VNPAGIRARLAEFLEKYGEKAVNLLNSILEIVEEKGSRDLGDFEFREVIEYYRERGIKYNPSPLLRILERDFGIIETSYREKERHWWRINGINEVKEGLSEFTREIDDEEIEMMIIKIKINSLELDEKLRRLKLMLTKRKLTESDKLMLRKMAFSELRFLLSLLREIEGKEELNEERRKIIQFVKTLYLASKRIKGVEDIVKEVKVGEEENYSKGFIKEER